MSRSKNTVSASFTLSRAVAAHDTSPQPTASTSLPQMPPDLSALPSPTWTSAATPQNGRRRSSGRIGKTTPARSPTVPRHLAPLANQRSTIAARKPKGAGKKGPQRPANSWMLWCATKRFDLIDHDGGGSRQRIAAAHPNLKNEEISSLLKKEWEEMKKNGESDYWTALAAELMRRTKEVYPNYKSGPSDEKKVASEIKKIFKRRRKTDQQIMDMGLEDWKELTQEALRRVKVNA